MMEFTEQEVTDIYTRLGLVSVVMGLDMDHDDIEHCGRVLCGMVEHPIFLTGRGILFTYNYNTRHITIYDNIIGSPGKFIISCSEIHPNKVADSEEEITQALEKLMKDLYFYEKLNAEIDISDALSVLE